jgi:hypothetical protein
VQEPLQLRGLKDKGRKPHREGNIEVPPTDKSGVRRRWTVSLEGKWRYLTQCMITSGQQFLDVQQIPGMYPSLLSSPKGEKTS